jgi:putative intracellular protease/amidase/DNA-directed RNA polymerase specialized sigma24 family protein
MKIGVLLADAFQDSEYFLPKFEIENAGAQTEVISLDSKPIDIYSYFSRIGSLDVDKTIEDADSGDYVGVLVPGGAKSPAILAESDAVRSFLRQINSHKGLVASICRGSLLVACSGIAEGRHITGFHLATEYPDLVIRPIVEKYGGIWRDDLPVVVDGNLISSRHPSDMASSRWTRRTRARPCGGETVRPSCRTARMPARRSSWAASSCSSGRRSMRRWNGRRAARPPHMALWRSDRSLPNSSGASKVKTSADELAHRAVEAAARQSYGRLVALLAARTRDPAGAEDALADALLAALNTWARDGIPKNLQAWLLTAARNRLLDHARHLEVRKRSASTLETLASELYEASDPDALPDERLKLLFVCAHPAIDPDMHTPLMLQTVLGLDAVAIGRAFLVSLKAMASDSPAPKPKFGRHGLPSRFQPQIRSRNAWTRY